MPRDEMCTVTSATNRPEVLNHEVRIEFTDSETRELLMRATFHLHGDAALQRFLRGNPTWRRGCLPFGLTLLYDYMWKKKLIEIPEAGVTDEYTVFDPANGITII